MRVRTALARLLTLGRVALAAGLLLALWFGTVTGVDRATREVDERRQADRLEIARAFAAAARGWFDRGRQDAIEVAARIGSTSGSRPQGTIDAAVGAPGSWGRSLMVVGADQIAVAASRDRLGLIGRSLPPCGSPDATEAGPGGLPQLMAAARGGAVVSGLIALAPDCATVIAAAAPAGPNVVVIVGDLNRLDERMAAAGGLAVTTRLYLVDGSGEVIGPEGVERIPAHLARFTGPSVPAAGALEKVRFGADAEVVVAAHPAGENWTVVLETDAAAFTVDLRNRPALVVAGALTLVFSAAFALVAFFDIRRRRAQRRADVAKEAFLSIVNHELRTPLTVLKGSTDVMTSRWERLDKAALGTLVESITPQVLRLNRVVDRLLAAANIHAGVHVKPTLDSVAVTPVLERAVAQFAAGAPLHEFSIDVDPPDLAVRADVHALEQVLVQLLDNAVRFSPRGGPVRIRAARRHRGAEITVEDEGVGLPSDRRRIFEAFTQGEAVDRRVHAEGGVGVGLFIVRTLVTDMGGDVRAEPTDAGSRFVVRLRPAST